MACQVCYETAMVIDDKEMEKVEKLRLALIMVMEKMKKLTGEKCYEGCDHLLCEFVQEVLRETEYGVLHMPDREDPTGSLEPKTKRV